MPIVLSGVATSYNRIKTVILETLYWILVVLMYLLLACIAYFILLKLGEVVVKWVFKDKSDPFLTGVITVLMLWMIIVPAICMIGVTLIAALNAFRQWFIAIIERSDFWHLFLVIGAVIGWPFVFHSSAQFAIADCTCKTPLCHGWCVFIGVIIWGYMIIFIIAVACGMIWIAKSLIWLFGPAFYDVRALYHRYMRSSNDSPV